MLLLWWRIGKIQEEPDLTLKFCLQYWRLSARHLWRGTIRARKTLIRKLKASYARSVMPFVACRALYRWYRFIVYDFRHSSCKKNIVKVPSPPHMQLKFSASFTTCLQTGHISRGSGVEWDTIALRLIFGVKVISVRLYPGHRWAVLAV